MFLTYAQNGEDIVLWRALGEIQDGTYVDVGAADPTVDSVTRAFYDRGWSGVNIEPVPALAEALVRERPRDVNVPVCAGEKNGTTVLHVVPETGLSTEIDDQLEELRRREYDVVDIEVDVRRLDDILTDAGLVDRPIHFLKIDVEGMEESVLGGLDLAVWRPWVIVVEATRPMSPEPAYETWEPMLTSNGYRFCLFDGLNRFYVAEERNELVPALSYPACVFDEPVHRGGDVLAHNAALLQQIDGLQAVVADLRARHDDAHARLRDLEAALGEQRTARARLEAEATAASRDAARWHNELISARATLDAVRRDASATWTQSSIERQELLDRIHELLDRIHDHEVQAHNLETMIDAMGRSVSWRVTRPLRGVRRAVRIGVPGRARKLQSGPPSGTPVVTGDGAPGGDHTDRSAAPDDTPTAEALEGFARRLTTTANLLAEGHGDIEAGGIAPGDVGSALAVFEEAVRRAGVPPTTRAWLGWVAAVGSYPDGGQLDATTRLLRRDGARGLTNHMQELFLRRVADGASLPDVEVVEDLVLIDVTHTAMYDLHTGIQRVVRECASRWLARPGTAVVHWSHADGSVKLLADDERRRLIDWHLYMYEPGELIRARMPDEASGATVIPWRCAFVLPELVDTPLRCAGYATMIRSGVVRRFSMIGYDLIPMTATETVTDGMTAAFAHYLSLVKQATHLSAISHSAADEFRAFGAALRSQGLSGPVVSAAPLPTSPVELDEAQIRSVRDEFELGTSPLVLVVGSHEPRKNHLVLLEAAEALWRRGRRFEMLLVGGASWGRSEFDSYVDMLASSGYPVRVYTRISESALWSLYRLARFSIFTSLIEGYGLPVAESLSCGTPVITTNYGSMAEIAAGGGALEVDPRDPAALEAAMETLLTDDELLADLRATALTRTWSTWDDYATTVWRELVEAPAAGTIDVTRSSTSGAS